MRLYDNKELDLAFIHLSYKGIIEDMESVCNLYTDCRSSILRERNASDVDFKKSLPNVSQIVKSWTVLDYIFDRDIFDKMFSRISTVSQSNDFSAELCKKQTIQDKIFDTMVNSTVILESIQDTISSLFESGAIPNQMTNEESDELEASFGFGIGSDIKIPRVDMSDKRLVQKNRGGKLALNAYEPKSHKVVTGAMTPVSLPIYFDSVYQDAYHEMGVLPFYTRIFYNSISNDMVLVMTLSQHKLLETAIDPYIKEYVERIFEENNSYACDYKVIHNKSNKNNYRYKDYLMNSVSIKAVQSVINTMLNGKFSKQFANDYLHSIPMFKGIDFDYYGLNHSLTDMLTLDGVYELISYNSYDDKLIDLEECRDGNNSIGNLLSDWYAYNPRYVAVLKSTKFVDYSGWIRSSTEISQQNCKSSNTSSNSKQIYMDDNIIKRMSMNIPIELYECLVNEEDDEQSKFILMFVYRLLYEKHILLESYNKYKRYFHYSLDDNMITTSYYLGFPVEGYTYKVTTLIDEGLYNQLCLFRRKGFLVSSAKQIKKSLNKLKGILYSDDLVEESQLNKKIYEFIFEINKLLADHSELFEVINGCYFLAGYYNIFSDVLHTVSYGSNPNPINTLNNPEYSILVKAKEYYNALCFFMDGAFETIQHDGFYSEDISTGNIYTSFEIMVIELLDRCNTLSFNVETAVESGTTLLEDILTTYKIAVSKLEKNIRQQSNSMFKNNTKPSINNITTGITFEKILLEEDCDVLKTIMHGTIVYHTDTDLDKITLDNLALFVSKERSLNIIKDILKNMEQQLNADIQNAEDCMYSLFSGKEFSTKPSTITGTIYPTNKTDDTTRANSNMFNQSSTKDKNLDERHVNSKEYPPDDISNCFRKSIDVLTENNTNAPYITTVNLMFSNGMKYSGTEQQIDKLITDMYDLCKDVQVRDKLMTLQKLKTETVGMHISVIDEGIIDYANTVIRVLHLPVGLTPQELEFVFAIRVQTDIKIYARNVLDLALNFCNEFNLDAVVLPIMYMAVVDGNVEVDYCKSYYKYFETINDLLYGNELSPLVKYAQKSNAEYPKVLNPQEIHQQRGISITQQLNNKQVNKSKDRTGCMSSFEYRTYSKLINTGMLYYSTMDIAKLMNSFRLIRQDGEVLDISTVYKKDGRYYLKIDSINTCAICKLLMNEFTLDDSIVTNLEEYYIEHGELFITHDTGYKKGKSVYDILELAY